MPCHCVEHTVTLVRRRLKSLEPSHSSSNFFARPLFRKLVAKTIGPILFPTVIEGAVGFKTNNAYATSLRNPLPFPAYKPSQSQGSRRRSGFVFRSLHREMATATLATEVRRQPRPFFDYFSLEPAKKVIRRPAGTGEVEVASWQQEKKQDHGISVIRPVTGDGGLRQRVAAQCRIPLSRAAGRKRYQPAACSVDRWSEETPASFADS